MPGSFIDTILTLISDDSASLQGTHRVASVSGKRNNARDRSSRERNRGRQARAESDDDEEY